MISHLKPNSYCVELHEQADRLDAVFVCVGGGGLISGIGTALRRLRPETRIVGVWPAASTNMRDSIHAGRIVDTPETPTLSDGSTGSIEPRSVTFPICQDIIDEMVTVEEGEIARAMRAIAESDHWIVEGSAGVALAGLAQTAAAWQGKTVAVVLCGRNVGLDTFMTAMAGI
jgi:threonine dehydratase